MLSLPNWKYRLRTSICENGLVVPAVAPAPGAVGKPTTLDESLMPGARPTWALMSMPSVLVVNTKFIQPGSRPLVSAGYPFSRRCHRPSGTVETVDGAIDVQGRIALGEADRVGAAGCGNEGQARKRQWLIFSWIVSRMFCS